MHTYMYVHLYVLYRGFVLVRGFFCSRLFCPGFFCLEGFVRPPSVIIHLLRVQQKAMFHTYEFFLKCGVTCPWTPPPSTNCHTFPGPLTLERDVLYGRPLY